MHQNASVSLTVGWSRQQGKLFWFNISFFLFPGFFGALAGALFTSVRSILCLDQFFYLLFFFVATSFIFIFD